MNNLLQKASSFLKQGKFEQAIKACDEILKNDSTLASALFIQAISYSNIGQLEKSLRLFNTLHKLHPKNSDVYYNKGIILQKNNFNNDALKSYKKAISLNSKNPFVFNNYANLLYQQKDFNQAIISYKKALSLDPKNIGFNQNLIKSLFLNKHYESCLNHIALLSHFSSLSLKDYDLEIQSYIELGNYRKAYDLSEQYTAIHPNHYLFHFLMGLSSLKLSRYPKAIMFFQRALKFNDSHLPSYMNLALSFSYLAHYSKANECILKLELISPDSEEILEFICTLKEMQNDLKLNDPYFIKAKSKYPNNIAIQLLSTQVLINSTEYLKAKNQLEETLSSKNSINYQTDIFYKQGIVYDKLSQFNHAWKSFSHANTIGHKKSSTDIFNTKLTSAIKQLTSLNSPIVIDDFSHKDEYHLDLIFIVGFPRSGTTLIDSILSCKKDSIVLEEVPLLDDVVKEIMINADFDNYYDVISKLSKDFITELRNLYINNISLYHNLGNNKTVIDKSPLNLIHTLLIHKLFPKAPIIFAVRHPYDSCLSCYMQNFKSNYALNNCLTNPKSISETYNNIMKIWTLSISKSDINYYYQYYEKLVIDVKNQTKNLIRFVNFEWDHSYLEFHQQSKSRGMIHNPSYNQVNKAIHKSKKFWHLNYLPYLASFGDDLNKWIVHFQYDLPILKK